VIAATVILVLLGGLAVYAPEVTFVCFISAGIYKADPRLAALGVPDWLDLTVTTASATLFGIAVRVLRRRVQVARPPLLLMAPWLCLCGLLVVGLLYTPAPVYGLAKVSRFISLTSFALLAPLFVLTDQASARRMLTALVWVAVVSVLDVVVNGGLAAASGGGFVQVFGSSGYLGLALAAGQGALVLVALAAERGRGMVWRAAAIVAAASCAGAAALSGGRTAAVEVLVLVVCAPLLGVWGAARNPRGLRDVKAVGLRLALAAGSVLAVLGTTFALAGTLFTYSAERLRLLFVAGGELERERLAYWAQGVESVLRTPFGIGPGGFSVLATNVDEARGTFPHNLFLEAAVELGLLGVIAVTVLMIGSFGVALDGLQRASPSERSNALAFLLLLAFTAVYFQFHGDINDARLLFAWTGCVFAFRLLIIRESHDSAS
jgi:hypothetical protein